MWTDFKTFLIKDNVIGLAIAFIIGATLVKLVTSIVDDIIMPVVNLATAATGGNWKDWYIPLTTAGADGALLDAVRSHGAVPRRVYTQAHIDYVIEVAERVVAQAPRLCGYRIVRQPPFLRHFSAVLEPLAS